MNRSIRLVLTTALALSTLFMWALPADSQERETLSGARNGPVTITVHTESGPQTKVIKPGRIYLATPSGTTQRPHAEVSAESDDESGGDDVGDPENVQDTESTPPGPRDGEEVVEPELTEAEAVSLLEKRNWVTYRSPDGELPKYVYNPETKMNVPLAQAIETLKKPVQQVRLPEMNNNRTFSNSKKKDGEYKRSFKSLNPPSQN